MRTDPLSPLAVLRALELFGPQARPYNFDDCFDCWGLVRRVFDHLDDGAEVNGELAEEQGGPEEENWAAFSAPDELTPGDLLVTHPHVCPDFHTVFYCGRVGGQDLVYDASPRAAVPLFARRGGGWKLETSRAIHTRYARATETTDRLRDDGGAYLRLWDDRERFYHRGLRSRLLEGMAADPALADMTAGRDLGALRRRAGLSGLPFYCRRRLPADAAGRELYDNLATRHLDYYVPDGAPLPDDDHETAAESQGDVAPRRLSPDSSEAIRGQPAESPPAPGSARAPGPRPGPPVMVKAPLWVVRDGPVTVEWEYPGAGEATGSAAASASCKAGPVTGCRVEVWEETAELWKHRLLRRDFAEPATSFVVPDQVLHDDARFAVVVWARGPGGFSGTALAPFLFRPGRDSPLLEYDPVRPEGLAPDRSELVPAGAALELSWRIRQPLASQASFRVEILEDAFLTDEATPVYDVEVSGPPARVCKTVVPGEALRAGHTYGWYVTVRSADRRTAFAPSQGVFRTAEEG
jgi:hypothetical protein